MSHTIEALPIERFEGFEPEGVAEWPAIFRATHGVPRAVHDAVRTASYCASSVVLDRAYRERPDAGYEDYTLHNLWTLGDPHWEAAERAAGAAAVAILLDGYLPGKQAADWIEGGARLTG